MEDDSGVPVVGGAGRCHDQGAGHAQGHGHHPAVGEVEQDAFGPTPDPGDGGAAQLDDEPLCRKRMPHGALPAHLDVGDLGSGHPALQVTGDRLDLGEFRHRSAGNLGQDRLVELRLRLCRAGHATPGAIRRRLIAVHLLPIGTHLEVDRQRHVEGQCLLHHLAGE